MSQIINYQYNQAIFEKYSQLIQYLILRNQNIATNVFISTNKTTTYPVISVVSNKISIQWALNGRINPTGTDHPYDIVGLAMLVNTQELAIPLDLTKFEDDYSAPAKNKSYNKLIIDGASPAVDITYEQLNTDYTGAYKISGLRSDDLGTLRTWDINGIANPSDPAAPTAQVNIKMVLDVPDTLYDYNGVAFPLL